MDDRLPERFRSKVVANADGCWMWTGSLDRRGYGYYLLNRKVAQAQGISRRRSAHRFCYEALVAEIPAGRDLDHLCRVPACVNPEHLEPVTRRENLRRGAGQGGVLWDGTLNAHVKALAERNRAKTHCPQGHPYNDTNTLVQRDGSRKCAECNRARMRVVPRPPRTHCPNGHEVTEANTYWSKRASNGRRRRSCRPCTADAQRRYQQRKRVNSSLSQP